MLKFGLEFWIKNPELSKFPKLWICKIYSKNIQLPLGHVSNTNAIKCCYCDVSQRRQRQLNFCTRYLSCKVFFLLDSFLLLHFKKEKKLSLLSGLIASGEREGHWNDIESKIEACYCKRGYLLKKKKKQVFWLVEWS